MLKPITIKTMTMNMNKYHVISLMDQQRCCLNCRYGRHEDGWIVCIEGADPDEKGFVYNVDCPTTEYFGICKAHELDKC